MLSCSKEDELYILTNNILHNVSNKTLINLPAFVEDDLPKPETMISNDRHILITYPTNLLVVSFNPISVKVWDRPKGIAVQGCCDWQFFVKNSNGLLRINSIRVRKSGSIVKSNCNDTSYLKHRMFSQQFYNNHAYWFYNDIIWSQRGRNLYGWGVDNDRQHSMEIPLGSVIKTSKYFILVREADNVARYCTGCVEYFQCSANVLHNNEVYMVYIDNRTPVANVCDPGEPEIHDRR